MDLGWYDFTNRFAWYPYQLEMLGLKADELRRDEYVVKELYMEKNNISSDTFEAMRKGFDIPIVRLVKETNAYACDMLWKTDNAYYMGSFQNIDNIREAIDDIKSEIIFPSNDDMEFLSLKEKILCSNSVGLHIRLADYDMEDFEQICPMQYYYCAIEYMREHLENPIFFVFSNKIEKAKEKLGNHEDFIFVDVNDRYHGIGDMELMALCKNNIIPNSTFGWWAAVFNKNPDKIVVAPNRFNEKLKNVKDEDINLWFDEWVRL